MSGNNLKYGLNIKKKSPGNQTRIGSRRTTIFDDTEESDDNNAGPEVREEEIREIGDPQEHIESSILSSTRGSSHSVGSMKSVKYISKKVPLSMSGDLSTSFTSKKYTDKAKELNENIYEYDSVYDSLNPLKKKSQVDQDRKPKYMANLIAAAAVRKRDATIAEERKLAREREAEGDEFADKEKFVTSAYKKQQEENRRLEREERAKEERDAKRNSGTGMVNFYKNVLEKDEQRHAEIVKAVDECVKSGVKDVEPERQKTAAELAREINEKKAGAIIVNDEGDVVDKRQLLTGGLNIISKPKTSFTSNNNSKKSNANQSRGIGSMPICGTGGGKQAMRERQSRMIEAQLEQASKRALVQEEEERQKIERIAKSRKTESEILGAKERYLARKREAEEAKKKLLEQPDS